MNSVELYPASVEIILESTQQQKNKSQLNSQPPWECLQPDTSWPSTPRRRQLSPIRVHRHCLHIHCFNIVTWFGAIGGISREFWILRRRAFCSENQQCFVKGFHEGKCLFYCQFDYLLIWNDLLNHPGNSSLRKLFWWWLFILSCAGMSVWKFATTERLTSGESSFSSILSNLLSNSLFSPFDLLARKFLPFL